MEKVNIREKLTQFSDHWNPRIIGELNNQHVKAVKLKGEFVWHHHDHEDELFLVIRGRLKMEFRDKTVEVNEGEFIIVPRMGSTNRLPKRKLKYCSLSRQQHSTRET